MNLAALTERSHADFFTSINPQERIRDNFTADRIAIETYSELVRWLGENDSTTRRPIKTLLAKEEEHAGNLATMHSLGRGAERDRRTRRPRCRFPCAQA
jgi:bacterioferritin